MKTDFYIISLFLAATISLALALRFWQRGARRGFYFLLLLISLAIGASSYAMELWGSQESVKFIWFVIKFLCSVMAPLFWLAFVFQYTEKRHRLELKRFFVFLIVPIITLVMLLTSAFHSGMFQNLELQESGFIAFNYGPYYWVHVAYMYTMFIAGDGYYSPG
ncbi:MAG: hypothetical protein HC806_01335 [Anaerolineae bacterium]|nr:hypothetical protein [Anaerolineae bacterium]